MSLRARLSNDASGNNRTGTLGSGIAAPTWTTGLINNGLFFNGDDYVTTNGSAFAFTGQSFTLEAWVKVDLTNAAGTGVLFARGDMIHSTFELSIKDPDIEFGWSTGDTTDVTVKAHESLRDGGWHHVAAVYDSAQIEGRVYVDGNEQAAKLMVPSVYGDPWGLTVGALKYGALVDKTFTGWMDLRGHRKRGGLQRQLHAAAPLPLVEREVHASDLEHGFERRRNRRLRGATLRERRRGRRPQHPAHAQRLVRGFLAGRRLARLRGAGGGRAHTARGRRLGHGLLREQPPRRSERTSRLVEHVREGRPERDAVLGVRRRCRRVDGGRERARAHGAPRLDRRRRQRRAELGVRLQRPRPAVRRQQRLGGSGRRERPAALRVLHGRGVDPARSPRADSGRGRQGRGVVETQFPPADHLEQQGRQLGAARSRGRVDAPRDFHGEHLRLGMAPHRRRLRSGSAPDLRLSRRSRGRFELDQRHALHRTGTAGASARADRAPQGR